MYVDLWMVIALALTMQRANVAISHIRKRLMESGVLMKLVEAGR